MSTDYRLVRTRSAVIPRSASVDRAPVTLVTRTSSVPDLTSYYGYSDRYTPRWHNVKTYYPYRYRRDYDLYDDYWWDKYYYFSPLYRTSLSPYQRYSYTDSLPNPYYWSPYSSYWTRYKGYWYDRYNYPYATSYSSYYVPPSLRSYYTPYRSYLLDSLSSSLSRGLSLYKEGYFNPYRNPYYSYYY